MSQPQQVSNDTEVEEVITQESNDPADISQEPAEEAQEESEAAEEPEFDPRKRVEFSTPEQQKKYNDIYRQVKMSDARNKMLTDMVQKLNEKNDELFSRFQQTDHAEAERILTSRLKEARDLGDEDKADKILQEIIDFRVDSKLSSKVEKQPKPTPAMDDPDVRTVVTMAQQTDERGNLMRPWIADNHPQHANAMKMAGALAMQVNAELGYVDVEEVFNRMDEAMKPKAKQASGNSRAPDPMKANLTNNPARGKMKLSPQELAAAQKLNVKPEDYLKWKR